MSVLDQSRAGTLVPVTDLPAIFHRSLSTIRRWVSEGTIPTVRVGGSRYMRRDDLDALLAPVRRIAESVAARELAGRPVLNAEQMALVRRALDDALEALDVDQVSA